jgi:short-subunit dehydrogenase
MNFKKRFGSWALVTGASSGIGMALAHRLAAQGVNLVLVARRENELKILGDEIERTYRTKTLIAAADLSDDGFLDVILKKVKDIEIDILVNNAGFGSTGAFQDISQKSEIDMIKVNCIAPVVLTRHFLKGMVARKKGALIFLSSIAANQPTPLETTYAATKVFDLFIGEGLSGELKNSGVHVLTVKPGFTTTGFQDVAGLNSLQGARTPEDVADTTMRSLGRKRTVTDGFSNKILSAAARIAPKRVSISLARSWVIKHKGSHKNS